VPLASEALRGLQETAQGALDELRLLIFDLRPPLLDQVGLVAAIQARLTAVEGRTNLQARLIADEVGDLPAFVEQELYRIAQEALNNALKHSRARHITLWLRREERRLVLEIVDDGVGFEPTSAGDEGGAGLRGITERVAGLGGAFALQSAPAAGTRLRVEVPL
jgi:signal transduction histidine kinase